MRKNIICILLLIPLLGYGQINTEEKPYSWSHSIGEDNISTVIMPEFDLEKLLEEDQAEEKESSFFRYGYAQKGNFTLENSGYWQNTEGGGKLWQLKIESPNALSLDLSYDKFWLPEGAKFFIYSPDKEYSIGAFTSINNKGSKTDIKGFSTGLIKGNSIILEYYEPKGVERGIISIEKVVSGYKDLSLYEKENNLKKSASSNAVWADQEKSIALVVNDGQIISSGVLLNNTSNDMTPYFLSDLTYLGYDFSKCLFYWNCNGFNFLSGKSTVGATPILNGGSPYPRTGDFVLMKLIEDPSENPYINIYYSGWDSSNNITSTGVEVSVENNGNVYYNFTSKPTSQYHGFYNITPDAPFWVIDYGKESWLESRTIDSNFLGNPLFNANGYLSGIFDANLDFFSGRSTKMIFTGQPIKYYKFWIIFPHYNNYLDPTNKITGSVTSWPGMNWQCTDKLINNRSITSSEIINGCRVSISNTTVSGNTTVLVNARESIRLQPNTYLRSGTTVRLKVIENVSTRSAIMNFDQNFASSIEEVSEENNFLIYPNPSEGVFYISGLETECDVDVYDISGQKIYSAKNLKEGDQIDMQGNPKGIYMARIVVNGRTLTEKLILK